MLLTDPTWRSPGGREMGLVAATPRYGWTDLAYSLVPNGAHLERRAPATDGSTTSSPVGFPKRSIVTALFGSGSTGVPPGSPHTTFTPELATAFLCLQSPLPIESNPQCAGVRTQILPSFITDRSAYYQNAFFEGLANGSVKPVPVYAAGTLTDPLFPGREHRRMIARLKAAVPSYPVKEYYGDYQHFVQNKRKEWSDLCGADHHVCALADYTGGDLNTDPPSLARGGVNDDLSDFVDHYAKPGANPAQGAPSLDVTASLQICPSNESDRYPLAEPGERFTASTFEAIAPNTLTVVEEGEQRTTSKAAPNPHSVLADPVGNLATNGGRCPSGQGPAGPGVASYESPELASGYTMVGPTRVRVPYEASGGELQLNARLYDVSPDGAATMVDRGFRTLTASRGTAELDLLGNGWRFERSHRIRVELAQDDDPYVKASTIPSSMTLAGVTLSIPVREASATLDQAAAGGGGADEDDPSGGGGGGGGGGSDQAGADRAASGSLPFTGLDLGPIVALGLLLAALGLTLRTAARV